MSSDDDDEDSEESDDLDELQALALPADDLSVADIITQANQQAATKNNVSFYVLLDTIT